ncbi:NAD(P)/FAD-dependent oxidoreductase [Bradyrhizobium sp. sBnM-33]|uniref:NAD(P)/FAD-dependent oxidoreductase n=1 Tax=Bradyrhizobium sp. sBnM-33 TaxID=2831780 RepID=UPI001BCB1F6B|nr:NAD(P)/FAD-dependent oxidoreductase [Bradyrhizobium sp. sBnM-33]WOH51966.1 NAD(P)/FAD-dependent oxidoreductase [Bradyrhizobium sp. sBnM-33]
MRKAFDMIVVGARCAGSPTAMLLARKGYRVLAVDRSSFPSDTISTHLLHPLAVSALSQWGLLDRLVATGCPPIHTYSFDFGAFTISGAPGTDENPIAYCPRRTILDKLLVDAAAESGAEIRQGFTVEEIILEGERAVGIKGRSKQGGSVTEYADAIVGADGRHSMVSEAVHPEHYRQKPPLLAGYYSYWSGLPMNGRFETYIREKRGFAAIPTHDDLTLVIAGWPYAEFAKNKKDIESNYLKAIDLAPDFAKRLRSATREAPFAGTAVPNYFRKPYGPGWALVGDAGYNKDFITAQGILDAFRDAELCATALDESFSGARPFEDAMDEYQRTRDAQVGAMYEFTCDLATLEPPPPDLQRLLGAVHGNQVAMDGFVRLNAGTISPTEFFAPQNTAAIFAAAASRAHSVGATAESSP